MSDKKVYNKLVRDNIPDIILEGGSAVVIRTLDEDEFPAELESKLDEEVAEFHESGAVEELADILEVVYALAAAQGVSSGQLEEMRQVKREERGGFENRVFLVSTSPV